MSLASVSYITHFALERTKERLQKAKGELACILSLVFENKTKPFNANKPLTENSSYLLSATNKRPTLISQVTVQRLAQGKPSLPHHLYFNCYFKCAVSNEPQ